MQTFKYFLNVTTTMRQIIKLFIFAFVLIYTLMGVASAQGNLMTVYCDGRAATDSIFEGEEICVYGVGYEADSDIDIVLEDETQVVQTSTQTTNNNGVLSLRNIWGNLKKGMYNFFADFNKNGEQDDDEESQALFVIGEPSQENPDDQEQVEEVPEFGTIAAAVVLGIAGFYIYKKRGAQE